ncbi:MAG: hypothetical protein Q4D82_02465 [Neisseria sp.]|nr:hypothetical protein [Neisseria sp.]
MELILAKLAALVKAFGEPAMLELSKSRWIKFCLGLAILAYPAAHFLKTLADILK